jgi:hypothetical protein
VLSSQVHVAWALAQGGTLEDRPRYNKTRCFETFPFPALNEAQKTEIGRIAAALDAHRKTRIETHPELTMTGLYNVLEAVRAEGDLSAKEKKIYELGLVGLLRELHDELDAAVLAAYGWEDLDEISKGLENGNFYDFKTCGYVVYDTHTTSGFYQIYSEHRAQIGEELLTRLVELNQQRAAEEARGIVRYLRPEYQNPETSGQSSGNSEHTELKTTSPQLKTGQLKTAKLEWPKALPEQAAAVRRAIRQTGWTSAQDIAPLAQQFKGVRAPKVQAIAEALIALGQAA